MSNKAMKSGPRGKRITSGETVYSPEYKGAPGNYGRGARVDVTDGFVGISTFELEAVHDRVLLSPQQWRKIVAFVEGSA